MLLTDLSHRSDNLLEAKLLVTGQNSLGKVGVKLSWTSHSSFVEIEFQLNS